MLNLLSESLVAGPAAGWGSKNQAEAQNKKEITRRHLEAQAKSIVGLVVHAVVSLAESILILILRGGRPGHVFDHRVSRRSIEVRKTGKVIVALALMHFSDVQDPHRRLSLPIK